jgi:hypothetical protein
MRDTMKTKKRFLNVVFNIERNPAYKGNHELATTHRMHTTFPLGTTEQEMISEFHAELVNISNGKTWTKGEMIRVVSIAECYEGSYK